MRRSTKESTVNSVCSILNSLKAGESILNEEAIPKSDITFELRLGKGSAMRYYLYSQNANSSQDKIISQLIENGTKYQGMGFTGGNVSDVISRLSKVSGFEDTGFPPFKMSMDISEIRLFNYRDHTCTKVEWPDTIKQVESTMTSIVKNGAAPSSTADLGALITDFQDMMLLFKDGTRLTTRLYEKGVQVEVSTMSMNAPQEQLYYVNSSEYEKLLAALRRSQGPCTPEWLNILDTDMVTSIVVMNPSGGKTKTFEPGSTNFQYLVDSLLDVAVEPLSMTERTKRSGLKDSYTIQIVQNNDVVYIVDLNTAAVEVEGSDRSYVASYKLVKGYSDATKFLKGLMEA